MTYLEPICALPPNFDHPDLESKNTNEPEQNFVLSEREAEAASPEDMAVCGEEDPGEGLEFLVTSDREN